MTEGANQLDDGLPAAKASASRRQHGPNAISAAPPRYIVDALNYDPLTGKFTWRFSSKSRPAGKEAGHYSVAGYIKVGFQNRIYAAHRLAWFFVHGEWPALQVDHINSVRDDNRIENLRLADSTGNNRNRKRTGNHLKGAYWHKRMGCYISNIAVGSRKIHLGSFKTEAEAHLAYCKAAERLHGEFARTE